MGEGLVTVLVAQHSRRPAFQRPSAPGNGGGAVTTTGLDFAGNVDGYNGGTGSPVVMFLWRSGVSTVAPFARQPATYIQRVRPRQQAYGYWSGLFYAQWQTAWNPGNFRYYGMHPYPINAEGTWSPYAWEISYSLADEYDNNPGSPAYGRLDSTGYDRWYTQVTIINGFDYKFYWDYGTSLNRLLNVTEDQSTEPTDPVICTGDAPWNQGHEGYCGVMRGFQYYDAALTLAQVDSELTTPGSVRTPWYLNLNPTPSDIADKSGNGNHPAWLNANRPSLWEG